MTTLLDKRYDGEELCDVGRDIYEALEDADVPVDEHGLVAGQVHVVVTFEPATPAQEINPRRFR